MKEIIPVQEKRERILTIVVLLTICIISFIPFNSLTTPSIASDDWSLIVAPYAFGELGPFNLLNHRPLDMSVYFALTSIFGLRFEYYYLFNALILFLSALLIYALVKRIFPQLTWLAGLAAIAYLVYPVDYTRTWIIMLYIRFWWLISLAAIWLLLDFLDSGNKLKLALALLGIIIPLGAYEGQFGVIVAASFLMAVLPKNKPVFRRLVLLGSVMIIGISFYLWRFYVQANISGIKYYSAGSFQFNPFVIIERYLQGFDIFFRKWLIPIQAQLKLSVFQIFIWLFLYIVICYFLTLLVFRQTTQLPELSLKQKLPIMKSQFFFFLVGGAFWIAGYFPILGLYSPALNGHASRVNLFAVAGAALMIVSLAAVFSTLLARSILQIRPFAIAILLPFVLAGIFVQLQVNIENEIAWETQRSVWNSTFKTISNVQDEKSLVIIIPGYEQLRPFESYPFTAAWEIDAEAKVLYNDPNIGGYFYYKDLQNQQFVFTKNGIIPQGAERLVGYKKLIFVLYNPKDNTVELVENLEETLSLPFSVSNYSPHENIIPAKPSTADFRWLVQ